MDRLQLKAYFSTPPMSTNGKYLKRTIIAIC